MPPGARSDVLLIVGLGNPGRAYGRNRHNLGFVILEELASRLGVPLDRERHQARLGRARRAGRRLVLAEPLTYMNLSGRAVGELMAYSGASPEDLVVVHDDLDLPVGKLRFKRGGGHGGHNGLRSIIEALGTGEFRRVKVGIGRPPEGVAAEDWVLRDFLPEERPVIAESVGRAVDLLLELVENGASAAEEAAEAGN